MNFLERILEAGFREGHITSIKKNYPNKPSVQRLEFKLNAGWYSTTCDNPDAWFTKEGEDKELCISLQGVLSDIYNIPIKEDMKEEYLAVSKKLGIKFISLRIGKDIIYHTFFGVPPSDEIVEYFINA